MRLGITIFADPPALQVEHRLLKMIDEPDTKEFVPDFRDISKQFRHFVQQLLLYNKPDYVKFVDPDSWEWPLKVDASTLTPTNP